MALVSWILLSLHTLISHSSADCEWMITYFCKPKLKVGTEWVQKGSTCQAAANSVAGIARAIYERTFRFVQSSNTQLP